MARLSTPVDERCAVTNDASGHRERLLDGLQRYGADFNQFGRRFADSLGLHTTDAEALIDIVYFEDQGTPLSPARLAERIHLTSGATTSLLNRLEAAGQIVRTREHSDRRVVTLRSGRSVHDHADAFFGPLGESIDAMMADYPPEILAQFEEFLADLHRTMVEHIERPDPA